MPSLLGNKVQKEQGTMFQRLVFHGALHRLTCCTADGIKGEAEIRGQPLS